MQPDATPLLTVTPGALAYLRRLLEEHPEEQVVRIDVKDIDETQIAFSLTLDSGTKDDDAIQQRDGVTIAVGAESAPRMAGVTLDYDQSTGFRFLHPEHLRLSPLPMVDPS